MTLRNVSEVLEFSILYNANQLRDVCSEYICNNLGSLMESRLVFRRICCISIKVAFSRCFYGFYRSGFAIIVEVRSYLLPFTSQHQRAYSPYCSLYISYGNDKENLSIYGELQSEIILFTLVALIYYSVMILYRKIRC